MAELQVLRKWLKKEDIFHPDLEKLLLEKGIINPEEDFKTVTQKQWEKIQTEAVVMRAKDLKSQQAKVRWEATLKKIEKYWRKQSGIKLTSIKKNQASNNTTNNTSENEQSKKYSEASDLKEFMKASNIWNTYLFEVLAFNYNIKSENDIAIKINKKQILDEIIREVRVEKTKDIKDINAIQRINKTLNKFEKIVISKNNQLKKTSILTGDDEKQLKEWEADINNKKKENAGKDIKQWLQKENIWCVELYDQLLRNGVSSQYMIQCIEESEFDEIVRTVRVERFTNVKDQTARQNIDKMLVKFEKLWRKQSGIKKTSIK